MIHGRVLVFRNISRMGSCLRRFCGINPRTILFGVERSVHLLASVINPKTVPFGVERSDHLLASVINPKTVPFGVERSVHLLVSSRPGSELLLRGRRDVVTTGTDTESFVSNASGKIQSEQQICACSSTARQVSPRYPPL